MYAEIVTLTGWDWDYVRHEMTLKRYAALQKAWKQLPPLPLTVFAIAKSLGLELGKGQEEQKEDIFYDESFFGEDKKAAAQAAASLESDWNRVNEQTR